MSKIIITEEQLKRILTEQPETKESIEKTKNFLKSKGWEVQGGKTSNEVYALSAMYTARKLTQMFADKTQIGVSYCLRVGSFGSSGQLKWKIQNYDMGMVNDFKKRIPTGGNYQHDPWNTFLLYDFYFEWGKIINDVKKSFQYGNPVKSTLFPDGWYNWFTSWFGTDDVRKLKTDLNNILSKEKPYCGGAGNKTITWQKPEEDIHDVLSILEVATLVLPVIGPFISAGIGLIDAGVYYIKDDNPKMAGMVVLLTLLGAHGTGKLMSKVPGLNKLTKQEINSLSKKVSTNNLNTLTKKEKSILTNLEKNKNLVKTELDNVVKKESNKILSKEGIKKTIKDTLKPIAKEGLKYTTAIAGYNVGYDELAKSGKLGVKEMIKQELGANQWNNVKSLFGSTGSYEDNSLLKKAWLKGWRPGDIVPNNYRTSNYKKDILPKLLYSKTYSGEDVQDDFTKTKEYKEFKQKEDEKMSQQIMQDEKIYKPIKQEKVNQLANEESDYYKEMDNMIDDFINGIEF